MPTTARKRRNASVGAAYRKVSDVALLPDYMPGIGTVYVDPANFPGGPLLAYDRDNRLTSTTYVLAMKELIDQAKLDAMVAQAGNVDDIDIWFDASQPGMSEPQYYVVLWHVPKAKRNPPTT